MFSYKNLFIFLSLLVSVAPAHAFDEHRQGFILGLGAGLHAIDIDFVDGGSTLLSRSESGLATSLKIGGGISDQFALYYVRNVSWYNAPFFNGTTTEDVVYTMGISGIGFSYFLWPESPSAYLLAAVGAGDLDAPFESGVRADTGSAYMLGAGYEFTPHVMVEATLLSTDIDSDDVPSLSVESSAFQLTLNYTFY